MVSAFRVLMAEGIKKLSIVVGGKKNCHARLIACALGIPGIPGIPGARR